MKAFPLGHPDCSPYEQNQGMDLRDYFAAKAMQGLLLEGNSVSELAKEAYRVADAMMKVRG